MASLPKLVNTDLSKGFTVPQVAEKHACPVGPEDRTGGGQSPLSGPLRWRAKVILNDYIRILNRSGWEETHIFQAPLSSERFKANVLSAMQKKKIIGVTSRYVIISKKK